MNQIDEGEMWDALWGIIEIDLLMHYDLTSVKHLGCLYYDYRSLQQVLQVPTRTLDALLYKDSAITIASGSSFLIDIENVIGVMNLYYKDFNSDNRKEQKRLYLLGI